uniref:tenascin-R-like n=1 Tax=Pristiophorus japonicus TaxID=55135 RepID=UPI00398F100E
MVPGMRDYRREKLEWLFLEQRRLRGELIEMLKIMRCLDRVNAEEQFPLADGSPTREQLYGDWQMNQRGLKCREGNVQQPDTGQGAAELSLPGECFSAKSSGYASSGNKGTEELELGIKWTMDYQRGCIQLLRMAPVSGPWVPPRSGRALAARKMLMMLAVLALCLSALLDPGECRVLASAHRRQRDVASARGHRANHTVPARQPAIVFNHVYNINVPLASLCSVSADSSTEQEQPSQEEVSAQSTQTNQPLDSQVAFTHNINIPKQACDCPATSLLHTMLNRLEQLERELSVLREQCSTGCPGESSATGRVDYAPICNGHGNFSMETCDCRCEFGWTGKGCSVPPCLANCTEHGECMDGQCVCDPGYTGQDCGDLRCPGDCSGHGLCVEAECVCEELYKGKDCGLLKCPSKCSGRGQCVNNSCLCDEGYSGEDCNQLRCLNDCSNNGLCSHGICSCQDGYSGEDCAAVAPPKALRATDVTDRSIGLEWTGPVVVTEYLITYTPTIADGVRLELRVPGNWTAATINELEPGVEYNINVYAVLNNKLSVPITSRLTTHLSTPQGLRFRSITETAVEVQWEPFQFSFDGWEINFIAKSNEGGMIVQLPSTVTSFNQSGLKPGEDYTVNLVALKDQSRSSPATATLSTLIDGPNQITIREVADTFAFVEWAPPRAHVDHILLSYGLASGMSEKTTLRLQPTLSQYSLQNLRPASQYQVSVSGIHEYGQSRPVTAGFTTGKGPVYTRVSPYTCMCVCV